MTRRRREVSSCKKTQDKWDLQRNSSGSFAAVCLCASVCPPYCCLNMWKNRSQGRVNETVESRGQRGDFFSHLASLWINSFCHSRSLKFESQDCTSKLRDLRCLTNRINDPPLIWSDVASFAFYFFHFQSMTDGYGAGDEDKRRRG